MAQELSRHLGGRYSLGSSEGIDWGALWGLGKYGLVYFVAAVISLGVIGCLMGVAPAAVWWLATFSLCSRFPAG